MIKTQMTILFFSVVITLLLINVPSRQNFIKNVKGSSVTFVSDKDYNVLLEKYNRLLVADDDRLKNAIMWDMKKICYKMEDMYLPDYESQYLVFRACKFIGVKVKVYVGY